MRNALLGWLAGSLRVSMAIGCTVRGPAAEGGSEALDLGLVGETCDFDPECDYGYLCDPPTVEQTDLAARAGVGSCR